MTEVLGPSLLDAIRHLLCKQVKLIEGPVKGDTEGTALGFESWRRNRNTRYDVRQYMCVKAELAASHEFIFLGGVMDTHFSLTQEVLILMLKMHLHTPSWISWQCWVWWCKFVISVTWEVEVA